ncbi:hypothetical protein [Jannaschia sp. 2305UL9-9]
MNHKTALTLALIIVAFVTADLLFNEREGLLFLARKLFDLIETLAIWR